MITKTIFSDEQFLLEVGKKLISLSQAATLTPYSEEYLGLLVRKGRLRAIKIARNWMTTREIVLEYVKRQEQKHAKLYAKFQQTKSAV